VAQQQARPGIRSGQAIGLTVFLVTAAFLTALLGSRITSLFDGLQAAAAWFSTLCAVVAAFGMLIDAVDLWVRGRTMVARTVRMIRMLVFIAVLGALAASLVGENSLVIPILLPSMLIYFFISRRRPVDAPAGATVARGSSGARGGPATRPASSGSAKARQRRGGKKRR
jgi:hypothetical protein